MLLLIILLSCATSFSCWALWEEAAVYEPQTQTIRVNRGEKEGVVLLKQYKYGRPVYLVSVWIHRQVERTQMITESAFYGAYQSIHAILTELGEKGTEACTPALAVTRKLESSAVHSQKFCVDKSETVQKLDEWFSTLKAGF